METVKRKRVGQTAVSDNLSSSVILKELAKNPEKYTVRPLGPLLKKAPANAEPGGRGLLQKIINGVCGPNIEDPSPFHIKAKPENHTFSYSLTY